MQAPRICSFSHTHTLFVGGTCGSIHVESFNRNIDKYEGIRGPWEQVGPYSQGSPPLERMDGLPWRAPSERVDRLPHISWMCSGSRWCTTLFVTACCTRETHVLVLHISMCTGSDMTVRQNQGWTPWRLVVPQACVPFLPCPPPPTVTARWP